MDLKMVHALSCGMGLTFRPRSPHFNQSNQPSRKCCLHLSTHATPSRREVLLSGTVAAGFSFGGNRISEATELSAEELAPVPSTTLAPGLEISQVIKGCWQLSGGHKGDRATDRTGGSTAVADFQRFVDAGITTFDTADIYGPSEQLIGRYLQQAGPDAARKVQVLTKMCFFENLRQAAKPGEINRRLQDSMNALGVKRLDMVQLYWHDYSVPQYVAAAQQLAEAQAAGLVNQIGVTNFDVPRMEEILAGGVKIASNQVQFSLLDRRPDSKLVPFCRENNIQILPFGTVAGGFLSDRYLGVESARVRADTYSKGKYGGIISQNGGWGWLQQLLKALKVVADKHGVSISDVSSRWVLDKPQVSAIIVGARNADHVAEHQRLFSFALDDADRAIIDEVLSTGVQSRGDIYDLERGGPW